QQPGLVNCLRSKHAIPRLGIVVAVRTLAKGPDPRTGFIVPWPTAPASRLQRTLRRNRPGRLGTLLRRRSGSMLHTTRSNLRELAAHIRTSETAGGAEVPVSAPPLKAGLAAIRWLILRPLSGANIPESPLLSSVHLCGAPHRP